MSKYVKVPIDEYVDLKESENKLNQLEAVGVDNWSGFEDAFDEEWGYSEFTKNDIDKEVFQDEETI